MIFLELQYLKVTKWNNKEFKITKLKTIIKLE